MYLEELETMTTRDEEIPTPKFALHRVHDILFVVGAFSWSQWGLMNIDFYSTHADRWTEVSCTQLQSYSALLINCKCH
jgi:hypothetical protein